MSKEGDWYGYYPERSDESASSEPNAAVRDATQHGNGSLVDHAPAPAAPDVAEMVKRLRESAIVPSDLSPDEQWQRNSPHVRLHDVETLLAKLGQGWIPPTEEQEAEAMRDILERQRKRNKPGASDE